MKRARSGSAKRTLRTTWLCSVTPAAPVQTAQCEREEQLLALHVEDKLKTLLKFKVLQKELRVVFSAKVKRDLIVSSLRRCR